VTPIWTSAPSTEPRVVGSAWRRWKAAASWSAHGQVAEMVSQRSRRQYTPVQSISWIGSEMSCIVR
jgi:hypothetical protein